MKAMSKPDDEQQSGHKEPASAQERLSVTLPESLPVDQPEDVAAGGIQTQAQERSADKELLDRVKTGERWMILLTALIFLTSAFQAYETWSNNTNSGRQLEHIVTAADRMNDSADSFSRSSADISR